MIREILTFGAVALGGGYLVKRYWDKKKADSESILSEHYQQTNAFNRLHRFNHLREKIRLSLVNLADKIERLGDFGDSFKAFQFVMTDEVYDLVIMSKNEAGIMTRLFGEICEALKDKEKWLDEIAQSVGKSLPAQTKSEITALCEIIKAIHLLITGDFVSESKWQNDKLTEAQNVLNALKSHPSKSSANQN